MKKFKASLAALLAVCSLLGLAGCSEKRQQSPNDGGGSQSSYISGSSQGSASISESSQSSVSSSESTDQNSFDTSSGNSESTSDSEPEQMQKEREKLSQNNMANSVKLFDLGIGDQKNAMFSPLSLNMALGLVQAGAKGETKKQIDAYLNTEDYADFAEKYLEYADTYLSSEEKTYEWGKISANLLEIANSFWAGKDLPLKEDYKKALSEKLGAEIENVDFGKQEETLKKINGWVNEKTHEMIPSILDSCDEGMKAVLINTVYFEADWSMLPWEIDESKPEDFTNLDGTVTKLPLMKTGGDYYFENEKATAFSRNYRNGMEFIGILPKENGDFTLESLDIPSLLESRFKINEKYLYIIHAAMPRLNFESKFDLNSALEAAGIVDLFDGSKSDLSEASDSPLMITSIMQKTKLELDEYGTKAAAVTEGAMGGGGEYEIVEKDVFLNRPFAFLIYDSFQDQIVFMGKVTTVDN